jgi:tryptophan synthase alpha chain
MTLRSVLMTARASGTSAFIPFVMAGDPDMESCAKIIAALQEAGADALELGVPFSDPVADGVTVQLAAERALARGATLQGVLDLVKELRDSGVTLPICLFSYLNPVYRMGYDLFVQAAKAAGVDGALIVDLPPEEAEDYLKAARAENLETVFLCSPTTTEARLKLVDAASSGFVYYVAREGVTGAQESLPQQVQDRLEVLRGVCKNPVAVGFGVSKPEHVRSLWGKADGIVVGSALIKVVEENPQNPVVAVVEKVRLLIAAV